MTTHTSKIILFSIRNRRRILLRYGGRSKSRIVEPHMLYETKQGQLILLGYQVRGYHSSRRNSSYWRPFQLSKIEAIHLTEETFQSRSEYGYTTITRNLNGNVILAVERDQSRYCYFNSAVCGPPTPAYLAETPSLMISMALASHS